MFECRGIPRKWNSRRHKFPWSLTYVLTEFLFCEITWQKASEELLCQRRRGSKEQDGSAAEGSHVRFGSMCGDPSLRSPLIGGQLSHLCI